MDGAELSSIHGLARYSVEAVERVVESAFGSGEIVDWLGAAERLVVVKPNWVQEAHEYEPALWEPVITHPDVVLGVVSTVARWMRGRGTICICDAPHTYADFSVIVDRGALRERLAELRGRWPGLRVELLDLRREVWIRAEEVVVERRANPEDPRGYVRVDLGRDSLLYRHPGEGRFYGADYDTGVVNEHHRGELHEYLLAGSPMACDLFVNLPKLKTHKKTGITCCLKNLVGINGDKNWLPHHTEGAPEDGGDEFPRLGLGQRVERALKRWGRHAALRYPGLGTWGFRKMRNAGKRVLGDSTTVVRNGNWNGNDTCWRMALDLNRALLYAGIAGTLSARPVRRYLAVVDGVVGGQGNGPLCPDPVDSGILVCGTNPAEIDAIAARLIGFDPHGLPIVRAAFDEHRFRIGRGTLDEVRVDDRRLGRSLALSDVGPAVPGGFRPHFGWIDQPRLAG